MKINIPVPIFGISCGKFDTINERVCSCFAVSINVIQYVFGGNITFFCVSNTEIKAFEDVVS